MRCLPVLGGIFFPAKTALITYFCSHFITMELRQNYVPEITEQKWNERWKAQQYFNNKPDGARLLRW